MKHFLILLACMGLIFGVSCNKETKKTDDKKPAEKKEAPKVEKKTPTAPTGKTPTPKAPTLGSNPFCTKACAKLLECKMLKDAKRCETGCNKERTTKPAKFAKSMLKMAPLLAKDCAGFKAGLMGKKPAPKVIVTPKKAPAPAPKK